MSQNTYPAGYVIEKHNTEISRNLPVGTLVEDKDKEPGKAWQKFEDFWAYGSYRGEREENGTRLGPPLRVLPAQWAPYTIVETPHENLREYVVEDTMGCRWEFIDGRWYIGQDAQIRLSHVHREGWMGNAELNADYGPYKTLRLANEIPFSEAEALKDYILADCEGDRWEYIDDRWVFGSNRAIREANAKGFDPLMMKGYEPFAVVGLSESQETEESKPPIEVLVGGEPKTYSAEEANRLRHLLFEDYEGDIWEYIGDGWVFGDGQESREGSIELGSAWEELSDTFEPYRVVDNSEVAEIAGILFDHVEASDMHGFVLSDVDGDKWEFIGGEWVEGYTHEARVRYSHWNNGWEALSAKWEPYKVASRAQGPEPKSEPAEPETEPKAEKPVIKGTSVEAIEALVRIADAVERIAENMENK